MTGNREILSIFSIINNEISCFRNNTTAVIDGSIIYTHELILVEFDEETVITWNDLGRIIVKLNDVL